VSRMIIVLIMAHVRLMLSVSHLVLSIHSDTLLRSCDSAHSTAARSWPSAPDRRIAVGALAQPPVARNLHEAP
jgi:hypothetical protein